MRSAIKNTFLLVNFVLFWGFLNFEYLAEIKKSSIINLFCIESFKEEMLKANIKYNDEIAKDTCDCYLEEFSKNTSHQKAISKCKSKTQQEFNLKSKNLLKN